MQCFKIVNIDILRFSAIIEGDDYESKERFLQ